MKSRLAAKGDGEKLEKRCGGFWIAFQVAFSGVLAHVGDTEC